MVSRWVKIPDERQLRSLWILAMVNSTMWALALIALAIISTRNPGVKGMYVILASGVAVATSMISMIPKLETRDEPA